MILFNVPPLKGHAFKRVRSSVSEKDIDLYSMELETIKWEMGDNDHSKTWGRLFRNLITSVNTLQKCSEKKK